jgi:hypothetical protein
LKRNGADGFDDFILIKQSGFPFDGKSYGVVSEIINELTVHGNTLKGGLDKFPWAAIIGVLIHAYEKSHHLFRTGLRTVCRRRHPHS